MKNQTITPNGKVYMNYAASLVPAHRDENGTVKVYVHGIGIWSSAGVPAHTFRPDPA